MSKEVSTWLEDLGLDQYSIVFEENAIDWELLPELDQETLKDIGVSISRPPAANSWPMAKIVYATWPIRINDAWCSVHAAAGSRKCRAEMHIRSGRRLSKQPMLGSWAQERSP